jgi:hypothetical protein
VGLRNPWQSSRHDEYSQHFCRRLAQQSTVFPECSEVARRITYLDTTDALATEVEWPDAYSFCIGSGTLDSD